MIPLYVFLLFLTAIPQPAFAVAGAVVTVIGMHEVLQKASERIQEAIASADGDAANRLNQIQLTLKGLIAQLSELEKQGVTDLNKAGDTFTRDALTAIKRASDDLSSVTGEAANSLNGALLEAELTVDSVPFVSVRPHLIGQKPYVLRKPASGDVDIELIGYFSISANDSNYPLQLRMRPSGKETALSQTRFGH